MSTSRLLPFAPLVAVLLGACAYPGSGHYDPGTTSAEVIQRMGRPTAEHPLASGGRRLEWTGGAYGKRTYMFDFDASDRLVRTDQVRDEAHFNAIKAGMNAQQVLTEIGSPSTTWNIGWQHQTVWSYRYETPFSLCQWFMVGMTPQGQVADTAYGIDPKCDAGGSRMGMAKAR